ncbi:MAG: cation transporter [Ruminococcaceae bacterium]|nr:cation transporter [Oscillospiraceae bacterium]
MKTEKKILTAFILNLAFSIFEFFGGMFTGSVAIISDALHDLGDAASIGLAFFLEKKSRSQPDEKYTYGYGRLSVLGGVITYLILLLGSLIVIYNAIHRIINPVPVNYGGMIIFAIIGLAVNFAAALITSHGQSHNQRAVSLHMLEDVLGWAAVLLGAIIMRFTDFVIIDPLMSLAIALFIGFNAARNLKDAISLFLEKSPDGICIDGLRDKLCEIEGIIDVHHIHIWSIDGVNNYATMHIVAGIEPHLCKSLVRSRLKELGISHSTLELETEDENCSDKVCHIEQTESHGHHHHEHHHHHHHHH